MNTEKHQELSRGSSERVCNPRCDLPERWRQEANYLRQTADAEGAARALESAAKDLDAWIAAQTDRLFSVREAANLVGRHPDTIRKAISVGRLTNLGRRGAPRVRKGELIAVFPPKKVAEIVSSAYDAAADAQFLLSRRGG